LGYDDVCAINDSNACATNFLFDLIIEVTHHFGGELEGILGMWTGDHPQAD